MESKKISDLEQKIKKYEAKMRDLIEAYKCVLKEKETLEKTIESLTRQKKVSEVLEGSSEVERLQGELSNLSMSIATLTDERRRMERSFLDDKRVMRSEYEDNLRVVRVELEKQVTEMERLRGETAREGQWSDEAVRLRREMATLQEEGERERAEYEGRLAAMEGSLAEISGSMGRMEKQHQADVELIGRLQERVEALVAGSRPSREQTDTPDILQFQDAAAETGGEGREGRAELARRVGRQIWRLEEQLRALGAGEGDAAAREEGACGHECEERVRRLTEELEAVRMGLGGEDPAARGRQGADAGKASAAEEELRMARARVADLQEQLSSLDQGDKERERLFKDRLAKSERQHQQEAGRLRQEHQRAEAELQAELTRHRNRTIGLLAEREAEVERLRRAAVAGGALPEARGEEEAGAALSVALFESSCPLYQCCETKARMDQELRRLRLQRRQLESAVHRLEADSQYRESDLSSEVLALSARLQQAEALGRLAGSPLNLEYLRNVFVRLLTSPEASSRRLTAVALARLLQLAPGELAAVEAVFAAK